jgi:hypothetical protein
VALSHWRNSLRAIGECRARSAWTTVRAIP